MNTESCKNIAQGYTVPTPRQTCLFPRDMLLAVLPAILCNNGENKKTSSRDIIRLSLQMSA